MMTIKARCTKMSEGSTPRTGNSVIFGSCTKKRFSRSLVNDGWKMIELFCLKSKTHRSYVKIYPSKDSPRHDLILLKEWP